MCVTAQENAHWGCSDAWSFCSTDIINQLDLKNLTPRYAERKDEEDDVREESVS